MRRKVYDFCLMREAITVLPNLPKSINWLIGRIERVDPYSLIEGKYSLSMGNRNAKTDLVNQLRIIEALACNELEEQCETEDNNALDLLFFSGKSGYEEIDWGPLEMEWQY